MDGGHSEMPRMEARAIAAAGSGGMVKLSGQSVGWGPQDSREDLVLDSILNPGDFPSGQLEKAWRQTQAGIRVVCKDGSRKSVGCRETTTRKNPGLCSAPLPRHSQRTEVSQIMVHGPPTPAPPEEFTGKHIFPM